MGQLAPIGKHWEQERRAKLENPSNQPKRNKWPLFREADARKTLINILTALQNVTTAEKSNRHTVVFKACQTLV